MTVFTFQPHGNKGKTKKHKNKKNLEDDVDISIHTEHTKTDKKKKRKLETDKNVEGDLEDTSTDNTDTNTPEDAILRNRLLVAKKTTPIVPAPVLCPDTQSQFTVPQKKSLVQAPVIEESQLNSELHCDPEPFEEEDCTIMASMRIVAKFELKQKREDITTGRLQRLCSKMGLNAASKFRNRSALFVSVAKGLIKNGCVVVQKKHPGVDDVICLTRPY